jgi:hypothetical protein
LVKTVSKYTVSFEKRRSPVLGTVSKSSLQDERIIIKINEKKSK